DEFGAAFGDANRVFVLPIYAASEEPLPGITPHLLTSKTPAPHAEFVADFPSAIAAATAAAREGDIIMTLGAGSVSQLGPQILAELESKQKILCRPLKARDLNVNSIGLPPRPPLLLFRRRITAMI